MTTVNWREVKVSKDARRDAAAQATFTEKLQVLERLRERTLAVKGARLQPAWDALTTPATMACVALVAAPDSSVRGRVVFMGASHVVLQQLDLQETKAPQ